MYYGFRVAEGTITALSGCDDNRACYTLKGDLHQMGTMEAFLRAEGLPVVKNNVYPGFMEKDLEEYKKALGLLFRCRVEGWWNQRVALLEHGICTEEQYSEALGISSTKT